MLFFSFNASAIEYHTIRLEDNAAQFVADIGNTIISNLADKSQTEADREKIVRKILTEKFDTKSISLFILTGYRRGVSEVELDEFREVFEDYIIALYTKQFAHYSGEQFEVTRAIYDRRLGGNFIVFAKILSKGKKPNDISFQLTFRPKEGTFRIMDVKIEGISMVLTLRDDTTAYLRQNNGDIQKLIAAIRVRIANVAAK